MTASIDLEVHELTATLRGDADPGRPVIVGQDGRRVVMLLNPDHAGILARIIARCEAQNTDEDLDFPLDRTTWLHAMVDLLASQAGASLRPVPVYTVPTSARTAR